MSSLPLAVAKEVISAIKPCVVGVIKLPHEVREFVDSLEYAVAYADENFDSQGNEKRAFTKQFEATLKEATEFASELQRGIERFNLGTAVSNFFGTLGGAGAQGKRDKIVELTTKLNGCKSNMLLDHVGHIDSTLTGIKRDLGQINNYASYIPQIAGAAQDYLKLIPNEDAKAFWAIKCGSNEKIPWDIFKGYVKDHCVENGVAPPNGFPNPIAIDAAFNKLKTQVKLVDDSITPAAYGELTKHENIFLCLELAGEQVGYDLKTSTKFQDMSLITAIERNFEDLALMKINTTTANLRDTRDRFPIFLAIDKSSKKIVESLLDKGASLDVTAPTTRYTPLMQAVVVGNLEIVTLILNKTPKHTLSSVTATGLSVLHLAAQHGHVEVVELLIKRGFPVEIGPKVNMYTMRGSMVAPQSQLNFPCNYVRTPIYEAAANGHLEVAQRLIDNHATTGLQYAGGQPTPLLEAVVNGHDNIVQLLCKEYEHFTASITEFSPLVAAARLGRVDIFKWFFDTFKQPLLTAGKYVEYARECLPVAAAADSDTVVAFIMEIVTAERHTHQLSDEQFQDLIYNEMIHAGPKATMALLKHTEDAGPHKFLALMAKKRFLGPLQCLIERSYPAHPPHYDRIARMFQHPHAPSALHDAAFAGFTAGVTALLGCPDIDVSRRHDYYATEFPGFDSATAAKAQELGNLMLATPLHLAVLADQTEVVDLLLKKRANLNKKDGLRRTPYDIAHKRGNNELASKLA